MDIVWGAPAGIANHQTKIATISANERQQRLIRLSCLLQARHSILTGNECGSA